MTESEPKPPACVVVDIQNGDQQESRLVVYANGRILYHLIENDWHSLIYGKGPWVDLDDVADRWPDRVAEVRQALVRMGSSF